MNEEKMKKYVEIINEATKIIYYKIGRVIEDELLKFQKTSQIYEIDIFSPMVAGISMYLLEAAVINKLKYKVFTLDEILEDTFRIVKISIKETLKGLENE